MKFTVRRLMPDDWAAYRAIRLEALRDLPEAFIDSFEEADKRPENYWRSLFDGPAVYFGAFDRDRLVGAVHCRIETAAKIAHKGWLYGMYVRDQARGTGCARALVEMVLAHALVNGALQVHLGVSSDNDRARHFYERIGFAIYGIEPRGFRLDEAFIDEIYMVKFLDAS